ncbi:MAG TPA: hypothetical protein VHM01_07430 [Alphaproteobacteria bacterium]|nr:hypothetical protein [Alphaproteobacteria bacterium]
MVPLELMVVPGGVGERGVFVPLSTLKAAASLCVAGPGRPRSADRRAQARKGLAAIGDVSSDEARVRVARAWRVLARCGDSFAAIMAACLDDARSAFGALCAAYWQHHLGRADICAHRLPFELAFIRHYLDDVERGALPSSNRIERLVLAALERCSLPREASLLSGLAALNFRTGGRLAAAGLNWPQAFLLPAARTDSETSGVFALDPMPALRAFAEAMCAAADRFPADQRIMATDWTDGPDCSFCRVHLHPGQFLALQLDPAGAAPVLRTACDGIYSLRGCVVEMRTAAGSTVVSGVSEIWIGWKDGAACACIPAVFGREDVGLVAIRADGSGEISGGAHAFSFVSGTRLTLVPRGSVDERTGTDAARDVTPALVDA